MSPHGHRIVEPLHFIITPIVEFIYPPTCFVCEALLDGRGSRVCASCWSTIKPVTDDDALYQQMHGRLAGTPTSHISHLISLFHFEKDGALQSMIHQLKYEGITSFGAEFGKKLGEKLSAESWIDTLDGIIPIPLHPAKLRERGYNQSEYIAKGIRDVTGLPIHTSLLKRHKHTSSQTKLNAVERRENVGDAFSLNNRYVPDVKGKMFLVVDDVITTGATSEACAEVLKNNGASKVIICSVALADHSALP